MGMCIIQTDRSSMMALKQRPKIAETRKTPSCAIYQIKTRGYVIAACEFGKPAFQGDGAEECATLIVPFTIRKTRSGITARKTQEQPKAIYPQTGSDEVGTGDYFGPVTVCVARVRRGDMEFLRGLGIQDSKVIDDTAIRRMVPKPMERLLHSLLILDNAIYSRVHGENNMVVIKFRMYSQTYVHLRKKMGPLPQFCIVDQLAQKTSYYRHLKHEYEVIYDIHFETKAENKYLSVAAGSIITRHASLEAFNATCERYDFTFLEGAGSKVDQSVREFMAMHGKETSLQVAELRFASTKKALG